jgi:hypothetical protein
MVPESPPIPERGLLTLSDAAWAQAILRSQMIAPLAALPVVGRAQAEEAAAQRAVPSVGRSARVHSASETPCTPLLNITAGS